MNDVKRDQPVEEQVEETMETEPVKPPQKSKRNWIDVVLVLFILVLIWIFTFTSCQKQEAPEEEVCRDCLGNQDALVDGELDLGSYEEIKAGLQAQVDDSYMNVKINVNPWFETTNSKGNLMIQNSKENKSHIKVFIELEPDGTVIYESPTIKPNQSIQEDTLDVSLEAGVYPAVAMFHILDPETHEKINEMGIKVDVTVSR